MQEIERELQGIRQMHLEAIETLRQSFDLKLEHMEDKVEQLELEVNVLKVLEKQATRRIPPSKAITPLEVAAKKRQRNKIQSNLIAQIDAQNSHKSTCLY